MAVNLFRNSQHMKSTVQYHPLGIHMQLTAYIIKIFGHKVWIRHWGTGDDKRRYDKQKHENQVTESKYPEKFEECCYAP